MRIKTAFLHALLLAACAAALLCQELCAGEPFRFVQVSDSHLGATGSKERLAAVFKEIGALQTDISFVALTGDVFDKGSGDPDLAKSLEEAVSSSKAPVYILPGNHDILQGREASDVASFEKAAGSLCKEAEVKGVQLLFLCVEPVSGKISIEGYEPLDWLEAALKRGAGKPAIIFLHTPPFDSFLMGKPSKSSWKQDAKERFSALLHKYPVKGVICGHLHRDDLHWDGDVPLISAPPVAGKFGRQATYRIFLFKEDGRLEYMTQYLRDAPGGK